MSNDNNNSVPSAGVDDKRKGGVGTATPKPRDGNKGQKEMGKITVKQPKQQ